MKASKGKKNKNLSQCQSIVPEIARELPKLDASLQKNLFATCRLENS